MANKNTLSSWLNHTMEDAYGTTTDSGMPLLHRSLHEVRAISASVTRSHYISAEDLLSQCRLSQHTTFTSFYLRDMKMQKEDLHCIGPIMTGGNNSVTPGGVVSIQGLYIPHDIWGKTCRIEGKFV